MMLPAGPLSDAAGAINAAASSVRPMGINSTFVAFIVVVTVRVVPTSVAAAVTVIVSATVATFISMLSDCVSASLTLMVRFVVAKLCISNVTSYEPAGRNGMM